jgi:hypothetical protein
VLLRCVYYNIYRCFISILIYIIIIESMSSSIMGGKLFELYANNDNDKISAFIQENLSVRDLEKNKYGEVFTPYSYICDILDQLPVSVWSNPGLRWLEPASGIGNFCVVIYMRLMDGLRTVTPNILERHVHILQNMLFMIEINEDNVVRTRDLFGPLANIQCRDFLDEGIEYGTIDADIIIGNPPYQTPRDHARNSSKGGQILWDKFILKSLELLDRRTVHNECTERFLCFITPPLWRKPNSPHGLWEKMTREPHSLQYLHMIDKKTAIRDLQVQQRMDLFIVKVSVSSGGGGEEGGECKVVTSPADGAYFNTISPRDWPFLPNSEFEFIKSIIDPNGPDPHRVIYDRSAYGSDLPHMSPEFRAGEFIYPVVHTMTRKGLGLWYSNTNTRGNHFGVSKVILNFNEKLYPYLDYAGEYGMGQFSFGLPVTSAEEGGAIVRALTSPQFRAVIKATKWGAYQTDRRMFEYFKDRFYDEIVE